MDREQWLGQRRSGIGGSDIAPIMMLSPWRSALEVYAEKRGLVEPPEDSALFEWGRRLEEPIAQKYAEVHGVELYNPGRLFRHEKYEYAIATPDRLVVGNSRGVEIKTASRTDGWGEAATDEVPEYYRAQCEWYMFVLGLSVWDLAVLFLFSREYREYRIHRNEARIEQMNACAQDFWNHYVLAGVPPQPGPASAPTLAKLYPRDEGDIGQADMAADGDAWALFRARQRLKDLQDENSLLENRLKASIGDLAGIEGRGWKATWKKAKDRASVEWEGVARNLAQALGDKGADALSRQIEAHTTTKAGSRVFRIKEEK